MRPLLHALQRTAQGARIDVADQQVLDKAAAGLRLCRVCLTCSRTHTVIACIIAWKTSRNAICLRTGIFLMVMQGFDSGAAGGGG